MYARIWTKQTLSVKLVELVSCPNVWPLLSTFRQAKIAEAFKLGKLPDGFVLPPDYNVAPTTFQPVIRHTRDTGERELVMMRWGMIPNFAKSLAEFKGLATINAQAETLSTSQMVETSVPTPKMSGPSRWLL